MAEVFNFPVRRCGGCNRPIKPRCLAPGVVFCSFSCAKKRHPEWFKAGMKGKGTANG